MDIRIQAFTLEEKYRDDIVELLFQLSHERRDVNLENHPNSHFVGAFDKDKLIGIAQIFILRKTSFTFGLLEDVIVDERYRGQNIGTRLVRETINIAKRNGANRINLTSRPERIEARKLFESLGFMKQDTDVFRLELH